MRRGCVYVDELAVLRLRDLVAGAGGKKRLRRAGIATAVLRTPAGDRFVHLKIVERPAWRGGSRSYLECPNCGVAVRQLLMNPVVDALQCRRCWAPTRLRYRVQEQRRLATCVQRGMELSMM